MDAPEPSEQIQFRGHYGADVSESAPLPPELLVIEDRLRGRGKNDRTAEILDQLPKHRASRLEQIRWDRLAFIEEDDRAGDVVELSATTWLIREQAFKELNVRCDDYGCIPILGPTSRSGSASLFLFEALHVVGAVSLRLP